VESCKKVFGMIRNERELIHRYFYGTRLGAAANNATLLLLLMAPFLLIALL